jgi:hypothetical protein
VPTISQEVAPLEAIVPVAKDGHKGEAYVRKPPGKGSFPAVLIPDDCRRAVLEPRREGGHALRQCGLIPAPCGILLRSLSGAQSLGTIRKGFRPLTR